MNLKTISIKQRFWIGLLCGVLACAVLGFTLNSLHLNTNQFASSGNNKAWLKDGAKITNVVTEVDAANYGFLTNATAADNVTALSNALAASKTVVIRQPGIYSLNNPVYVPSERTVAGVEGVVLKKTASYSHVFANDASRFEQTATNHNITIRNIIIDANANGTQTGAAHPTGNGHIYLAFCHDALIDSVSITNGDATLYGVHLASAERVLVRRYIYEGLKDGLHISSGCRMIELDGFDISSADDPLAILGNDYPRVTRGVRDIEHVVLRNGIARQRADAGSFFLRLMGGAWTNWISGNTYKQGDVVVNSGHIYKVVNTGTNVASVAPTVTSGAETNGDGIGWRWLHAGTNWLCNVRNVTLENCVDERQRSILIVADNDGFNRSVYPGTESIARMDNIRVAAITFTNASSTIWSKHYSGAYSTSTVNIATSGNAIQVKKGTAAFPAISAYEEPDTGFDVGTGANRAMIIVDGVEQAAVYTTGIQLSSTRTLQISSGAVNASSDTFLGRSAVGTWDVRTNLSVRGQITITQGTNGFILNTTNGVPGTPGTIVHWIPVKLNGTNGFMPLYQ